MNGQRTPRKWAESGIPLERGRITMDSKGRPKPYEIRELRKRHGISREELARSLYHIKVSRIIDWELDRRKCPPIIWWAMRVTWDQVDLWEEEQ